MNWRAGLPRRCRSPCAAWGANLQDNFKAVLQAQLSKLDLVSRQEFDVQAALLQRTQAKLADMESRLAAVIAKLPQ